MNEEKFRQIAQEELSKQIMENLNSGIIFKYINTLEERNKDLEQIEKEHKEENGKLRDKVKELEKENKIIEEVLDETDNEYLKGYHDCNDEWETKIKEKIKELKKKDEENLINAVYFIKALQELLEESEK